MINQYSRWAIICAKYYLAAVILCNISHILYVIIKKNEGIYEFFQRTSLMSSLSIANKIQNFVLLSNLNKILLLHANINAGTYTLYILHACDGRLKAQFGVHAVHLAYRTKQQRIVNVLSVFRGVEEDKKIALPTRYINRFTFNYNNVAKKKEKQQRTQEENQPNSIPM